MNRRSAWVMCGLCMLVACGSDNDAGHDATTPADASSGNDAATAMDAGHAGDSSDDGARDASFERPDGGAAYDPEPGTCGFDAPAFCETFESGPAQTSGRSGEFDIMRWSGARGGPWNPPDLGDGYAVPPALLPECRSNLPRTVLPDRDALVCDPIAAIPTRHGLITAASQNYGLTAYRMRQPFDFTDRTGTIKLDAELVNDGLGGWAAVTISEDPSPTPSFDWEERGSGPRNGIEIEFFTGFCGTPNTLQVGLFRFHDYVQSAQRPSGDCDSPHTTTARNQLNHVEIYLSRDRVEVWASEPSPDGRTFSNVQKLLESDLNLPFSRGYVSLVVRNHATLKYWRGSAALQRFDNIGFDGPVIDNTREHSVPDSLVARPGLEGCTIGGQCMWRGDAIATYPQEDGRCPPDVSCTYDDDARTVGYVLPRADEPPVSVTIPDVNLDGAVAAQLALAVSYPWFAWSDVFDPPTAISLRYRLNDGPWHERFITEAEANAFTDYYPEIGGAGHGAGLLNQRIDLTLGELRDGDNTLEMQTDHTWTGEYRAGALGIDLIVTHD